jgi:hypothetical protein
MKSISPTDTIIIVDDPEHLEEISSWEGHARNLNMIKIGKELIYYLGVSKKEPYRLLNVKRGYWGTVPVSHQAEQPIYKLQVTLNYGYDGLIPNMELQDKMNLSREKYKRAALLLTDFLDDLLTSTPNILQSDKDMHLNLDKM